MAVVDSVLEGLLLYGELAEDESVCASRNLPLIRSVMAGKKYSGRGGAGGGDSQQKRLAFWVYGVCDGLFLFCKPRQPLWGGVR